MFASASEEEAAAEVQSDAYRPLMFTDREAEKVGDKGAATLAPEGGVDEPALNLRGMDQILKQLESIQQGSPKNIVILGTRHCSFLHQQIIELLSFALVLSDNHIFTSGATGTHAAAIRGAFAVTSRGSTPAAWCHRKSASWSSATTATSGRDGSEWIQI